MRKFLFYSILPVILMSGCGQSTTDETENSKDWNEYKTDRCTVYYPQSWTLDDKGTMGTTFQIISKQTSDTDLFQENINLVIQEIAGQDITLDTYAQLSKRQLANTLPMISFLQDEKEKRSGHPCHHFVFTGIRNGQLFRFEQIIWLIDGSAYSLTFTAEQKEYERFKEEAEKILKRFEIK